MTFIFGALLLAIPATLVILCAKLFGKWTEDDRWLALVPLIPFPAWFAKFLFDAGRSSSSHNLFPFEIVGLAILGFMILPIVAIIYDFKQRRKAKANSRTD